MSVTIPRTARKLLLVPILVLALLVVLVEASAAPTWKGGGDKGNGQSHVEHGKPAGVGAGRKIR